VIFGTKRERASHVTAIVRDVVEVVAIVIAGFWAFYVFAYENRIKPSFAKPDVNATASMQRLGEHNGLVTVSLRLQLHNVGTVKTNFVGIAINVFGERVVPATPPPLPQQPGVRYVFNGYSRTQDKATVYTVAYLTHIGDPKTGAETGLDPGTSTEIQRVFYVPKSRFDLLTMAFDAPFTKYDNITVPSHLAVTPDGTRVVTPLSSEVDQFNIIPVTTLDIR
jgi:hypothetical protein